MPQPDEFERRDEIERGGRKAIEARGHGVLQELLLWKKSFLRSCVELNASRTFLLELAVQVRVDQIRAREPDTILKNLFNQVELLEIDGLADAFIARAKLTGDRHAY